MLEKLTMWLFNLVKHHWVTSLLVVSLITTLVYSLEAANWVRDETALSSAFLTGILFGWMLARSRFSGWLALPYSLMIAIIIATEEAGRILPGRDVLFSRSLVEIMEQMSLRIVNFSLRIGGWVETLQAGENVKDPGLFVGLLALLLALSAIWFMWSMMRRRNIYLGVLPIGLLFAINVHLSRQPLINFVAFLFFVLLLIVRTEYNRQHEEWQRRSVDYPEQLGLEWGGAALAIVLIIAILSRAAPLAGTPEGWRVISEWVNRAHEETSTTATKLFSGVNPPPASGDDEVYVNTPNLSDIGAPVPQGEKTIMWVRTSDPPPPPPQIEMNRPVTAARVHYWRSGIFGSYTGRGWKEVPKSSRISGQGQAPLDPPVGRYFLRQDFQMEARHTNALFSVNDPVQTSGGVSMRQVQPDGSVLVEGQTSHYEVISAATRVTANQLAAALTVYPQEIRAQYLALPASVPARIGTLANRIIAGESDPYHKALKIQNYLRENYQYNLQGGAAPADRDVVDYFLFEMPVGSCSHYASAMAVMLREVGIPARVATGYAMGEYVQERQAFRVPELNAHAWVEVFFPGYGWVEFEPTAYRNPIVYAEEVLSNDEPSSVGSLDEKPALQAEPYFIVLVLVGALLLLALPFLLLQMFSTSRQASPVQVSALYRRMRRTLAWAGLGAEASITPDEYLAMYSGHLGKYALLNQALHQATALYRETVYGPRPPDERRVRSASLLWRRSFRDWLVLWLRAKWRKLRAQFAGED